MTDEQLQQFQAALDACSAAWAEITRIAREVLRVIARWWKSIPFTIRRTLIPRPPTIMRRKIARSARMNC